MRYSHEVESQMKLFYKSLSEKDRRRYAAIEAAKLGHGGIEYMAHVVGCHADTIRHGRKELEELPHDPAAGRVRKKGGQAMLS